MKIRVVEIIPSINVHTFEEVQERIKKIEPHVKWVHLDITDGVFSKHLTWRDPKDLVNLRTNLNVEVHLMVFHPEKIIKQWLVSPVKSSASNGVSPIKRVIVHVEAEPEMEFIIYECRKAGVQVGLAINPETSWTAIGEWTSKVDLLQTLAVHPGPSGQEIDAHIFGKIVQIRNACPKCLIEIDGGINPENAKKARQAGVDILVADHYIFGSGGGEIGAKIEELKVV